MATLAANLPGRLDMHQALAWVRYRDVQFAASADADSLEAETLFGSRPLLAGREELKAALVSGVVHALGAKQGAEWCVIPAPEWLKLDIAPRDPDRTWPYLAITLKRDDLLRAFPETGGKPRRRGRTLGSGSLERADLPLIAKMAELIHLGEASSPDAAARLVAEEAKGGGTIESKATRLAKRFRDREGE